MKQKSYPLQPSARFCPSRQKKSTDARKVPGKKLFGRFNELVLLLIGFTLTTLFGNHIAYQYQRRQWFEESRREIRQFKTTAALETYEETVEVIEHLYVDCESLARKFAQGGEMQVAHENYILSYYNFRLKMQSLYTKIHLSFGFDTASLFIISIAGKFLYLDKFIRQIDNSEEALPVEAFSMVDSTLLEIQESKHDLNQLMLDALLSGKVGTDEGH